MIPLEELSAVCLGQVVIEPLWILMSGQDIEDLMTIAAEGFAGMRDPINSEKWFCCNLRARPRMSYYVARFQERIIGYILWIEHGGFRKETYLELEQLAVKREFRSIGIGSVLITESLTDMRSKIKGEERVLKTIKVTTGSQNITAQRLYQRTIGAQIEHTENSPYHEEEVEVVMYKRY